MTESILVKRAEFKNIYSNFLTKWDTMVSLKMFQWHLLIRTLKREKTAGGEIWEPIHPLDLMLQTLSD